MSNSYSPTWFELFLRNYSQVQTEQEIAFLVRQLPRSTYRNVLDICCGYGRHALALAALGYVVTGIDRDAVAIAQARERTRGDARFLEADMRDLAALDRTYDAAINLWQSFGYFDPSTNSAVLKGIYERLNPSGRLILDIYHRDFFAAHAGTRTFECKGRHIVETKTMAGNRLVVSLDYDADGARDVFDWQLYTPDELCALADEIGFQPLVVCANFDEAQPATADIPRMQLVLEKRP